MYICFFWKKKLILIIIFIIHIKPIMKVEKFPFYRVIIPSYYFNTSKSQ